MQATYTLSDLAALPSHTVPLQDSKQLDTGSQRQCQSRSKGGRPELSDESLQPEPWRPESKRRIALQTQARRGLRLYSCIRSHYLPARVSLQSWDCAAATVSLTAMANRH